MVKILLTKGVSVHQKSEVGYFPLLSASAYGYLDMVSLLLQRGAPVELVNEKTGRTSLIVASALNEIEVMDKLIGFGAKLDFVSSKGETPLMCAAANAHIEAIDLLLKRGSKIDLEGNGRTPLMIAVWRV